MIPLIPLWVAFKAFFAPAKLLSTAAAVGGFVIKHWKECLFAGMALTIFYQNFMDTEVLKWVGVRTIPGIERQLAVTEAQLTECENSREALKKAIETVNAQVDQWANVSSQLQQSHNALVAELNKMKKDSQKIVDDILKGPTPETCEAAIEFLKEAAQGDLKWRRR